MPVARVVLDSLDDQLPARLLGTRAPRPGLRRAIGRAGLLVFVGARRAARLGAPDRLELAVQFGSENDAAVVANWLWSELHGEAGGLWIEGEPVAVQHAAIKAALLAAAGDGSPADALPGSGRSVRADAPLAPDPLLGSRRGR